MASYFLLDQDFPTFGQLGCSGYIIADPTGAVLCPKTPSWLQHRNAALAWMSSTLRSLAPQQDAAVSPRPAPSPAAAAHPATLVCNGPGCTRAVEGVAASQARTAIPDAKIGDARSDTMDYTDSDGSGSGEGEGVDWSSSGGEGSEDDHEGGSGGLIMKGCANAATVAPAVRFEVPETLDAEPVDREHRACARRLNALARRRDASALARAIAALAAHFAHEERLLLAGAGGGRAAAAHAADHAAILALARAEQRRCRNSASGPERAVRQEFLAGLADRFAFHTREYDVRCAAALCTAVTATEPSTAPKGLDAAEGGGAKSRTEWGGV